jgi:hypothetical protein
MQQSRKEEKNTTIIANAHKHITATFATGGTDWLYSSCLHLAGNRINNFLFQEIVVSLPVSVLFLGISIWWFFSLSNLLLNHGAFPIG